MLAVCFKEGGNHEKLEHYALELEMQKAGIGKNTFDVISELMVVEKGKYIHGVADVAKTLKTIVEDLGHAYVVGNGFY